MTLNSFLPVVAHAVFAIVLMLAMILAIQTTGELLSGKTAKMRRGYRRSVSFARFAGEAGNIPPGNPDVITLKREELESIVRAQVSAAVADKMLATNKAAADEAAATKNKGSLVDGVERVDALIRHSIHGKDGDPFKGKGIGFAQFVKTITLAKMNGAQPIDIAKARGYGDVVKGLELQTKATAMSESVMADGGALVPDEFSAEFIEILRARTAVRALGARALPMNRGSITLAKQTGAGTATYQGENLPATTTKPAVGVLQLSAKKLTALAVISNDLIRDNVHSADQLVRDDCVKVVALREDLAFIRGDGTQFTPKGIKNWLPTANVNAATQAGASATATEVIGDLAKMIRLVEESNVGMVQCGWILTPRSKWYLAQLRDGVGGFLFKDEIMKGTIFGYPFKTTTQVPNNLGGGTNESEVYFGDFSEAIIGENTSLLVEAFPNGTYVDSATGNVVSGVSNDQTVVRVIERHDFGLRHENTFSMLTTVKWI
jgi:HK97 family phage major capsid protein